MTATETIRNKHNRTKKEEAVKNAVSRYILRLGAYLEVESRDHAPPFGQKSMKIHNNNAFLTTFLWF